MAFKFRIPHKPYSRISVPGFPSVTSTESPEQLMGMVDGKTASAPEERWVRSLKEVNIPLIFRYVLGAPKGMPGWKELDVVAEVSGLIYLMEIDTAFTHRSKEKKDILHDALAVNDWELNAMGQLWPQVIHLDGDTDLASMEGARQKRKQLFGR